MTQPHVRRQTVETREDAIELLEDRLSEPRLLPGEDRSLYDAMACAIRKQLAPRGLLQRLACNDIVDLRWELLRHRRLRQKSLERWLAGKLFECYSNSSIGMAGGRKPTEDELPILAINAVSDDPDRREAAEASFDLKIGVDREHLLADAYAEAPMVKSHDAKLNMLMRQHRQAMRDYEDLRQTEAASEIPDAEIGEEAA
jgi:hypothetical protein